VDFDARLCEICHLAQLEADIDAVNKLYVEQRVKTLTNQQKESDEKLTSFEKDMRALQTIINEFQRAVIKAEQKQRITMSGNERRDGYKRLMNNFERFNLNQQRAVQNGCQIATKQLRIAIERLRNDCRMAIERL